MDPFVGQSPRVEMCLGVTAEVVSTTPVHPLYLTPHQIRRRSQI